MSPVGPLPFPSYPQNFSALLFIKPVPLDCSSLTLQTEWGHTQQRTGDVACARLHRAMNARRRVLKRWQCARAEAEAIIVAMLRGRRRRLHPWLFPSPPICLSPPLLSGFLSSSKETRGGVLSSMAHRNNLSVLRFAVVDHALITNSSQEFDSILGFAGKTSWIWSDLQVGRNQNLKCLVSSERTFKTGYLLIDPVIIC